MISTSDLYLITPEQFDFFQINPLFYKSIDDVTRATENVEFETTEIGSGQTTQENEFGVKWNQVQLRCYAS